MISLIAACDQQNAIAKDDVIPWEIPEDLKWFRDKTMGHTVVMGRNTFESIGGPLIGRKNIVLSRNTSYKATGCVCLHSVEEVLSIHNKKEEMFIIGGEEVYKLFLPFAEKIYLTKIEQNFEGDKFFPKLSDAEWAEKTRHKGVKDDNNPYDYWYIELERGTSKLSHSAYIPSPQSPPVKRGEDAPIGISNRAGRNLL
jgi:dihydrofolate reductase